MMIVIIGLVIEMACIVAVANHLNKKIDMLDEAVYQYMKDEHNANYVPKEFHDKTCEAMAKRHQDEIADMVSVVRCKECRHRYTGLMGKMCIGRQNDDFCSYAERRTDG